MINYIPLDVSFCQVLTILLIFQEHDSVWNLTQSEHFGGSVDSVGHFQLIVFSVTKTEKKDFKSFIDHKEVYGLHGS